MRTDWEIPIYISFEGKVYEVVFLDSTSYQCRAECDLYPTKCTKGVFPLIPDLCSSIQQKLNKGNAIVIKEVRHED